MSKLTCQFRHVNELDLSPRRRVLLWAAVVSGLLLSMLDQTIVGTALPLIVGDLGGPSWYVWAFTAYLVPATVLLPVAARLSDRHGRQRLLLAGMAVFVAGSLVCAAAGSMPILTTGRAIQGTGAAALEALSFIVVSELSRTGRPAAGQAALAAVMTISFVAGPLVGGLLGDHVGWRWVFLVNVPIGIAAMVAVVAALPASFGRSEDRATPVDLLGIAVLTLSVGAVLIGLTRHQQHPTWFDLRTGGLVALGAVGLVVLLAVERRAAAPIVPPRLLGDPLTGRLLLAGATATTGLYAGILLLPRWYQTDRGASATESGVLLYPLLLALLVGVNLGAAAIVRRGEFRGVLVAAGAVTVLAAAGFGTLTDGSPGWLPLVLMALLGLGMGPALSGLQLALARTTAPRDLGAAMGTLLLGRQVVGTVALAVSEAVWSARLVDGDRAAATGTTIAVVAAAGALAALVTLLGLGRTRGRLPAPAASVAAGQR